MLDVTSTMLEFPGHQNEKHTWNLKYWTKQRETL